MNTRTIVTVMTAAFLSVSLVEASAAQDKIDSAQEGIEVITIIGRRPAPTVAIACVDAVARKEDSAGHQNDGDNFSDKGLESSQPRIRGSRTSKHCPEQFGG